MSSFIKQNRIVVIYGILSIALELWSLLFFDCAPYITHPIFPILCLGFQLYTLFLIPRKRVRAWMSFIFLFLQSILIIGCYYLYYSNGTIFEISMINQRNDAYATVEEFYVAPALLSGCIVILVSYLVFLILHTKKCDKIGILKESNKKRKKRIALGMYLLLIIMVLAIPLSDKYVNSTTNYKAILYNSNSSYQKLGVTGNFIYEMLHGNTKVDTSNLAGLEKSIYAKRCDISKYNGISKGNNLIMILAESFEWYPMSMYSKELTAKIYPNLTKLKNESVLCTNFYSREKTDTAEALTLIGSNPTGKYVDYDFPDNQYPYSLPNLFRREAIKEGDTDVRVTSFHQNTGNFYNRNQEHRSFGFDDLVDIKDMKKYGVKNTWFSIKHERNLDSQTVSAMKDEMIPKDNRFFSYWITFSTHGFYKERENLKEYYNIFDKLEVFPKGNSNQNYLRTYAAAVADLDKAIGIMFNDLKKKGLLDTTTVLLVADHNTYYNGLSNYAKKIDTKFEPELYRVPMMIYDQKLVKVMNQEHEGRCITKFTTTSDVIPTVFDLLQIPAWDNLYLGSTIFNKEKESIIYSRAYNIFITDKYIGYSLNNLRYKAAKANQKTKADFEKRALKHLGKLERIDKIFYSNYFSKHPYNP
ncbi:LTA synthase family protein [Anaeromicropila herbilytica]|uniref:Sulfatase N-terminal domain-containing protein n=1 Tax=Anaeromicropila herbilytica TaxID=2785025 RepID=A0A7R7EHR0_9FIRM|nr:alkaline phosphatase family protein [Anaeromicropila herbilytica]BCN28891.1 hypothetical protein bsdtb5_01860 [Anaeromicropila herbilytica]